MEKCPHDDDEVKGRSQDDSCDAEAFDFSVMVEKRQHQRWDTEEKREKKYDGNKRRKKSGNVDSYVFNHRSIRRLSRDSNP